MIAASDIDAVGETFTVDGLLYTVTADNEVSVKAATKGISGDVTIPASIDNDGATYSVTSIAYQGFVNCPGITGITIPDSVISIADDVFRNCTGITAISIPDGITYIGSYSFYGCTGLTSVSMPDSVTTIADSAFRNCTGLASLTIPQGVTSIGNYALWGCTALTSITIPANVTSLGDRVFYQCSALEDIWFLSDESPDFYGGTAEFDTQAMSVNGVATTIHTLGWATDETFANRYNAANTTILVETISLMDFTSDPGADGIYAYT